MDTAAWRVTPQPCACGCGGTPIQGRFLRGHYTRLARQTSERWRNQENPEDYMHDTRVSLPLVPHVIAALRGESRERPLPPSPSLALITACFADAWRHRRDCKRRKAGIRCRQCTLDGEWARATAALALYSFANMCEMLGFIPERVRGVFLATAN
jgi:hypothetical protein